MASSVCGDVGLAAIDVLDLVELEDVDSADADGARVVLEEELIAAEVEGGWWRRRNFTAEPVWKHDM